MALNVAKVTKRLRSQLKVLGFDEVDPISISAVFKEFRAACDSIEVHEELKVWLFLNFMRKPASSSLSARSSFKKWKLSGLHDKRLLSYFEVFDFLLATYATHHVIS